MAVFHKRHKARKGTTVAGKHLVDQFVDVHNGLKDPCSPGSSNEQRNRAVRQWSPLLALTSGRLLARAIVRRISNPVFYCGVAIFLLGVGNWWIGSDKVQDHRALLRTAEAVSALAPTEGFEQLSARTNASLLKPFRVSFGRVSALEQKLEFYRVVKTGGRILAALGLLLALWGAMRGRGLP